MSEEILPVSDSQTPKLGTQPTHAIEEKPAGGDVDAAVAMLEEVAALAKSNLASISQAYCPHLNAARSTLDYVAGHIASEVRSIKSSLIK